MDLSTEGAGAVGAVPVGGGTEGGAASAAPAVVGAPAGGATASTSPTVAVAAASAAATPSPRDAAMDTLRVLDGEAASTAAAADPAAKPADAAAATGAEATLPADEGLSAEDAEVLATASPKAQARIRELAGKAKQLEQQVAEVQPWAEAGRGMHAWMQEHGIEQDAFAQHVQVMEDFHRGAAGDVQALERCYAQIGSAYEQVCKLLGRAPAVAAPDVLAGHEDLKAQVEQFGLPPELAQELAQARAMKARSTEQQQLQQQRQAQAAQVQQAAATLGQWAQQTRAADPDAAWKLEVLVPMVEAGTFDGGSAAETLQRIQAAYAKLKAPPRAATAGFMRPAAAAAAGGAARPLTGKDAAMAKLRAIDGV